MPDDIIICALVFKGLICALKKEMDFYKIKYNLSEAVSLKNHDLAVLEINKIHINKLRYIKTAEDLFIPLCEDIKIRVKKDLSAIDKEISLNTVADGVNKKNMIFGKMKKKSKTRYAVFIKQDHDHDIYRHEIQAVIEKILGGFKSWEKKEPADVEIWGFFYNDTLKICLRLTTIKFRQRNYRASEREGALRPTIAAGLVALSNPRAEDVFMDPMCGSGTIILERALFSPYKTILAGDSDPDAVLKTKENLKLTKINGVSVQAWDAVKLPAGDNSIDTIIANPPWGKKFGKNTLSRSTGLSHGIDKEFYLSLVKEFYRIAKPFGKILILTSQDDLLKNVLDDLSLRYESLTRIKILGIWAEVFLVRKLNKN